MLNVLKTVVHNGDSWSLMAFNGCTVPLQYSNTVVEHPTFVDRFAEGNHVSFFHIYVDIPEVILKMKS